MLTPKGNFVSDRKLIQDLYHRASVMNTNDQAALARFGKMAAEYIGETIHQSFDGHEMDDWKKRRAVMKTFADMELCFQMMDADDLL